MSETESAPISSEGVGLQGRDPAGTVRIRDLTIPLSSLVSPEFREFYISQAARIANLKWDVPAPGASKAEWIEFDHWQNTWNREMLVKARQSYGVHVEETAVAGVPVAVVVPERGENSTERRVLINLRGGGFLVNRGLSFGLLESIPVSALGGFKVVTVDYRQAPFHSHPAAAEDVEAVYRYLLKTYGPGSVGIYGSSAGGLLAAQAIARFASKGLPRPGAVGVLSMSLSPPSQATDQFRAMGDSAVWCAASELPLSARDREALLSIRPYLANADTNDPLAWPGSSEAVLAEFPPTLFLVGTREAFMSPAAVDHARMVKLGVDAYLYVMEGACHVAHVTGVGTPEARDANRAIARFFQTHLG